MKNMNKKNQTFQLYDLKIEVCRQEGNKPMVCNHKEGSFFYLKGENIIFPEGTTFPIYCLASLMPILPAKQRETDPFDWMSTDAHVACPDPYCAGLFKITRLPKKNTFNREDVTVVKI